MSLPCTCISLTCHLRNSYLPRPTTPPPRAEFESSNGVSTTSAIEWEIVVCPKAELVETSSYPERAGFRETPHLRAWCRVPTPLREVWGKAEDSINPRLEKAGHSTMMEEEVVAGRLYTGPMSKLTGSNRRTHS